jgi:CBS domain-containing protein
MDRIAVTARFRPEQIEQVRELLAAGPPYDPADAEMDRHAVYLSAREAIFVFEGPDAASEIEDLVDDFLRPALQEALSEWRQLLDEEPRIARPVFVWERGAGATLQPGSRASRVGELMETAFVGVDPDATLAEAVERMAAGGGAAPALVVDYGRLIGLLSAQDVLRAVAERVHPSDARAREWMVEPQATLEPDTSPDAAATLMVEHGLHHLPVVEGERPLGIVALRTLVAAARTTGA